MSVSGLKRSTYGEAILEGFTYLLENHEEVFVIGQGLWSPWYVGSSMTDLDKKFGIERVMDSPVSELACTGAAVGASLFGYRPIVVHPRMDFMLYAMDPIVNQAAKWSHMLGGQAHPAVTIRGIINRGGEQGAQHSQALHSWFAHIPGLRVVMPATVEDARDLLIAGTLCDDPVIYIDDRWLYHIEEDLTPPRIHDLASLCNIVRREGKDITLAASSYSFHQCQQAADELAKEGIDCELVDLRILNPLDIDPVIESVQKTGNLIVVDGGWQTCGLASEVVAGTCVAVDPSIWSNPPVRINLPATPAPTSKPLEELYYINTEEIITAVRTMLEK